MKILLVGPYPPPHGGVSVHVAELRRRLEGAGIACRVANIDPRAPASGEYLSVRDARGLVAVLWRHARQGWLLHLHANGHNPKSWQMALVCGLAGRLGGGALLTLHSGMAPAYLRGAGFGRRLPARAAARMYHGIVAVNSEIRETLVSLGVEREKVEMLPAFLAPQGTDFALPAPLADKLAGRRPLLAVTLFFRPEYGFDVLVEALGRLRRRYPQLGCAVMGGGEQEPEAKALLKREGLEDAVLLLGDMPHEMCLAVMARADVFVRPSRADGDAVSVREALALGTPVVASRVGARPDGVLLFEPGNARQLAGTLDAALQRRADGSRPAAGGGDAAFARLLELYARVAGAEPARLAALPL